MPSYPVLFAGGTDALPPTTFTIPQPSPPPPPLGGTIFPSPPLPPQPPQPAVGTPAAQPLPCGMDPDTHTVTVTSTSEVLEVIFDNLSDNPHNMHMHG